MGGNSRRIPSRGPMSSHEICEIHAGIIDGGIIFVGFLMVGSSDLLLIRRRAL